MQVNLFLKLPLTGTYTPPKTTVTITKQCTAQTTFTWVVVVSHLAELWLLTTEDPRLNAAISNYYQKHLFTVNFWKDEKKENETVNGQIKATFCKIGRRQLKTCSYTDDFKCIYFWIQSFMQKKSSSVLKMFSPEKMIGLSSTKKLHHQKHLIIENKLLKFFLTKSDVK